MGIKYLRLRLWRVKGVENLHDMAAWHWKAFFSVLPRAHLLALRRWNFLLDAVKKAIVYKIET